MTQLAWKQVKPILQYHNIIPIHRIVIRIRSHRIAKNASYLRVYRHHASYCWKSPSHLTSLTIKYGGATGLSIAICGCFETLTRSPLIYSNEYAKRLVFRRAFRKIWPRAMATAREKRRSAWCNTTFSVTWLGRVWEHGSNEGHGSKLVYTVLTYVSISILSEGGFKFIEQDT